MLYIASNLLLGFWGTENTLFYVSCLYGIQLVLSQTSYASVLEKRKVETLYNTKRWDMSQ